MNLQFLNIILLAILATAVQFTMYRTATYYIQVLQYKVHYLTLLVYHTYRVTVVLVKNLLYNTAQY